MQPGDLSQLYLLRRLPVEICREIENHVQRKPCNLNQIQTALVGVQLGLQQISDQYFTSFVRTVARRPHSVQCNHKTGNERRERSTVIRKSSRWLYQIWLTGKKMHTWVLFTIEGISNRTHGAMDTDKMHNVRSIHKTDQHHQDPSRQDHQQLEQRCSRPWLSGRTQEQYVRSATAQSGIEQVESALERPELPTGSQSTLRHLHHRI
jgi:hypothetical protein